MYAAKLHHVIFLAVAKSNLVNKAICIEFWAAGQRCWNTRIKVNSAKVNDQTGHPVYFRQRSGLSIGAIGKKLEWRGGCYDVEKVKKR